MGQPPASFLAERGTGGPAPCRRMWVTSAVRKCTRQQQRIPLRNLGAFPPMYDRFAVKFAVVLDSISKVVGVVAGIASVITLAASIYSKFEQGNLVLSIDKDVVTSPPKLAILGAWAAGNYHSFTDACKSRNSIKPTDIQNGLCQIPNVPEPELYSRSDFGSVTLSIANGRGTNVKQGTTLRISKLKSFQGITANSDFIADMSKNLDDWNKLQLTNAATQSDPDNKDLFLTLPELKTGGFLRLTVYGLNSGFADADIVGLEDGPPSKVYVVKSSALPTSRIPRWVMGLAILLLIVSGFLTFRPRPE
jgi:hypothetical protein